MCIRDSIERCPFMENKTFCSACKVHCYKPVSYTHLDVYKRQGLFFSKRNFPGFQQQPLVVVGKGTAARGV